MNEFLNVFSTDVTRWHKEQLCTENRGQKVYLCSKRENDQLRVPDFHWYLIHINYVNLNSI